MHVDGCNNHRLINIEKWAELRLLLAILGLADVNKMKSLFVLLVFLLAAMCSVTKSTTTTGSDFSFSCPNVLNLSYCKNSAVPDTRTPIYILALVPFPDDRENAGWDYGVQMLPGGRIARDFINCNRSDLLPGYRLELIESNHEACGISQIVEEVYINLARFGLDQECGPVVAIAGLTCSPSTVRVSQVAGRVGSDLIQLASAGSPIFDRDTDFKTYPRLWRYVSSAGVYVDVVIELMKQLDWSSIGLIHDLDSEYYFNIAQTFIEAVKTNNFTLRSSFGLESTNSKLLSNAIQSIKDSGIKVIFCSTTFAQSTLLICRAANEGLVSPNYLWIFPDMYIADFEEQILGSDCDSETLHKGINRSLLLQYDLLNKVDDVQLSGGMFRNYLDLYKQHLEEVQRDYDISDRDLFISTGIAYSHLLFDQIWSLANALNQSFPQLHSMNISIEHNTVGNAPLADLLENSLSQLNILGITGKINFDEKRVYPTTIRIVYPNFTNISTSCTINETTVGRYRNKSLLSFKLNLTDVPLAIDSPMLETLPAVVIAFVYLAILTVTVLVSIVLGLFYYNRNKPKVKASSPFLTIFMFIGCYLLCLAAVLRITYGGFGGKTIVGTLFAFMCGLELFLEQNGYSLILVTLFIKLLRVHHIFNNKQLRELSNIWKNGSLAVLVLILCTIPNILSIVIVTIQTPNYNKSILELPDVRDENGVRVEKLIVSCNLQNGLSYIPSYFPLVVYLILIIYLSITMRRIKNRNFKDTKKVNVFVMIDSLLTVAYIISWWFLLINHKKQYVVLVQSLFPLAVVVACQAILIAPKVTPPWWTKAVSCTKEHAQEVNRKISTSSTAQLISFTKD